MTLLTALYDAPPVIEVGGRRLGGADLQGAVGSVAARVAGARRVAVVAAPALETVVAVAGIVAAGAAAVPINPASGSAERAHLLRDAAPDTVLDATDIDLDARAPLPAPLPADETPALIVYTSGTTGRPKGALLPRRAVAFDLDALADAWEWTASDLLAHALPLFHVHGLVLGALGPLRLGCGLSHTARFGAQPGATMYFGVPTMWSRLPDADLDAMRDARLLVSGSAALPSPVFERVAAGTGHRLTERYGLTETLIVTAARTGENRRPGVVGRPLPGVDLHVVDVADGLGEVVIAGPSLFLGYLGGEPQRGPFRTGDLASLEPDGALRILGRRATDLIKTGGFKVGAGEVENALLGHPGVAEAAVVGEPDDDLGERITAYVVRAEPVTAGTLIGHVSDELAPHKRPREVIFVDSLPRNAMGKLQKAELRRKVAAPRRRES